MKELLKLILNSGDIYICGNGGSASTAEHFTNDLFSKGIPAVCLNSNTSIMTMIANDFGYEQTFSRQLLTYAMGGDLLITISCSGTSPNILEAIQTAKEMGMKVYSFETFKGKDKDYGKLEDKHLRLVHRIKDAL